MLSRDRILPYGGGGGVLQGIPRRIIMLTVCLFKLKKQQQQQQQQTKLPHTHSMKFDCNALNVIRIIIKK